MKYHIVSRKVFPKSQIMNCICRKGSDSIDQVAYVFGEKGRSLITKCALNHDLGRNSIRYRIL